jgi:hypothetical protein
MWIRTGNKFSYPKNDSQELYYILTILPAVLVVKVMIGLFVTFKMGIVRLLWRRDVRFHAIVCG